MPIVYRGSVLMKQSEVSTDGCSIGGLENGDKGRFGRSVCRLHHP